MASNLLLLSILILKLLIFTALSGTNIDFILDVPNSSLEALADQNAAAGWVRDNILNYPDVKFRYISVGNEVSAEFLLTNPYPPSEGAFRDNVVGYIEPIIRFLKENNSPMLANIYPYFAYIGAPNDIELSYALFTKPDTGDQYKNLFDAMYDAHLAAQRRLGGADVPIVVSESGWPSAGGNGATMENAGTYYRNLIAHVKRRSIETYLFAMFDEDQKPGEESEKHFGVFFPNQSSKYNLSF
ncbi:glycoside hydrolase, catalytic domain-containing protein [Tanacetum coccineum]